MDILEAEGWGYLENHFKESGFIPNEEYHNIFAIHTNLKWKEVLNLIKSQWGYLRMFESAKILKKTKMKNGKINFVFKLI